MQGTICKWGNSLAVRLPRHLTDEAKLAEGTPVELQLIEGVLTITPTRKKLTLAELLNGEPERTPGQTVETDWGSREGKEAW